MLTVKLIHNSMLSIQFNFRDKAVFEECKRRCKELGATWNAESKSWIASARKLDTVIDAFPKASYAYEVFGAHERIMDRDAKFFVESLMSNGYSLSESNGMVELTGKRITKGLIATRDKLSPWALRHMVPSEAPTGPEATKSRPTGNSAMSADRQASDASDTLTTAAFGLGGGYDEWLKAEERKAQMIKNRRYGK